MNFDNTYLDKIVIHKIGNKSRDENILISKQEINPDDDLRDLLLNYFIAPFKSNEYYNFYHEDNLNLNSVFASVSEIFENQDTFYTQSVSIANHLYDQTINPKINEGEFFIIYLSNCIINDTQTDAIGLFKSETKDTFLKFSRISENINIEEFEGVNINKVDRGCIIFNSEKQNGYKLAIIDNTGKSSNTEYWKDSFLKVRQMENDFFHTANTIKLCKTFITEKMPTEFEVSKADQADFLNKSVSYFKDNDDFTFEQFKRDIIVQPELISSFDEFKEQYQSDNDLKIPTEFSISENAVKKQARVLKSVIKLDKNFHIYVHGDKQLITKGFDDKTGMNYYQIYFKDEN